MVCLFEPNDFGVESRSMKTNASGVGLVRLRNVCDVDVVVDDDELSRVTHTHIHTHTYTEPFLILFRFFHFHECRRDSWVGFSWKRRRCDSYPVSSQGKLTTAGYLLRVP